MILSFCFCLFSGVVLGTRYRVYVLVPASAAALLLAVSVAVTNGASLLAALGFAILFPAAVQAGYASALVLLTHPAVPRRARLHSS